MLTEEKQQKGKHTRWNEISGRGPIPSWRKKRGLWSAIRAAWRRAMAREVDER